MRGLQAPARTGGLETWLARQWWQPRVTAAARLLLPLSWLYRAGAALARWRSKPAALAVPVVVVGNLVVGGAGKTPIVIALARALAARGWRPGVVSRGHGRQGAAVLAVHATSDARDAGDEPLLMHRRTGVPVFVGRRRAETAKALCAAHPEVDLILSDDGLQHHALPRVAQLIVFDDRGTGNGCLLPAGPLREPLPAALPTRSLVAYTGTRQSTPLPGWQVPRRAHRVVELEAWARAAFDIATPAMAATPLAQLRGRPIVALAGIGAPAQFFAMLESAGLTIEPLPCPDHARYDQPPWPAGTTEVITTEKDAIKLAALPALRQLPTKVWVLPLDCTLPEPLLEALMALLPARASAKSP